MMRDLLPGQAVAWPAVRPVGGGTVCTQNERLQLRCMTDALVAPEKKTLNKIINKLENVQNAFLVKVLVICQTIKKEINVPSFWRGTDRYWRLH